MGSTVTREEAASAFRILENYTPRNVADELEVLGKYVRQLEELNDRLAQHAAQAGKILETGRDELIRHGWDKCAEAVSVDPKIRASLKAAYPYDTEEKIQ